MQGLRKGGGDDLFEEPTQYRAKGASHVIVVPVGLSGTGAIPPPPPLSRYRV